MLNVSQVQTAYYRNIFLQELRDRAQEIFVALRDLRDPRAEIDEWARTWHLDEPCLRAWLPEEALGIRGGWDRYPKKRNELAVQVSPSAQWGPLPSAVLKKRFFPGFEYIPELQQQTIVQAEMSMHRAVDAFFKELKAEMREKGIAYPGDRKRSRECGAHDGLKWLARVIAGKQPRELANENGVNLRTVNSQLNWARRALAPTSRNR